MINHSVDVVQQSQNMLSVNYTSIGGKVDGRNRRGVNLSLRKIRQEIKIPNITEFLRC